MDKAFYFHLFLNLLLLGFFTTFFIVLLCKDFQGRAVRLAKITIMASSALIVVASGYFSIAAEIEIIKKIGFFNLPYIFVPCALVGIMFLVIAIVGLIGLSRREDIICDSLFYAVILILTAIFWTGIYFFFYSLYNLFSLAS